MIGSAPSLLILGIMLGEQGERGIIEVGAQCIEILGCHACLVDCIQLQRQNCSISSGYVAFPVF